MNRLSNADFLASVVIENEEIEKKREEMERKIHERLDQEGFVYHRKPARVQQTSSGVSLTGRKYFLSDFGDAPAEGPK